MKKLKVLDLFSGLGGFSLGLEQTGHFETVAFCDNNKYSKLILDKHWKGIKIYDDIREITKEKFTTDGIETPDIITGGVPCQPFSVAGKQKGTSDDRYLWPEMFRLIKAFKSKFVIVENVRGIVNIENGMVFETVCSDLESEGYEVQAFNIPAAGVGAPHRRERIWFIAVREESVVDTNNIRFKQHNETEKTTSWRGTSATSESTSDVADTNKSRSGERQISGNINNEGRRTSETRGESIQSQDRQTCTSNIGSSSENVGDTKHDGSPTSKIGRGNEEINGGTEKRQNSSFEFEGTSRSKDNGNVSKNVADTENRRGKQTQSKRWESTKRGSIDRGGIEREGQDLGSTTDRINVADTNDEGLRTCIGRSDNDHETESGSGGTDRVRGSSDVERNNSTSTEIKTMDVADTQSKSSEFFSNRGSNNKIKEQSREKTGKFNRSSSGQDVTNTIGERGCSGITERQDAEDVRQSSKSSNTGWWNVEPNVGRVAHGVSGRVHRLRGLGNSIIPQIVEEIGYAIIKAMK